MADLLDKWTTQARKGILELAILTALADRECYAYELVKSLVSLPGLGVSEGTIYPLLSRLRAQGLLAAKLVESAEGPARKYYRLTQRGHKAQAMMKEYLDTLLDGVDTLRRRKGNL